MGLLCCRLKMRGNGVGGDRLWDGIGNLRLARGKNGAREQFWGRKAEGVV
jgi:hypothetical protein